MEAADRARMRYLQMYELAALVAIGVGEQRLSLNRNGVDDDASEARERVPRGGERR